MREEKRTAKKIVNLKRGYQLCHALAPTYIGRQCVAVLFGTILQYMGIYLSGMIVSLITGESPRSEVLRMVLLYAVMRIFMGAIQVLIIMPRQEQLEQGFTRKAKNLIAEKCMKLDYVRIEDPEIHRMKQEAENYLYGTASRFLGLGRIFYDTKTIFASFMTVLIGVGMCFRMLFLTPVNAKGFLGFVQSVWAVVLLIFLYGIIIVFRMKLSARVGKVFSELFAEKDYIQNERVRGFYMDFHKNRYQRGKDIRIYDQAGLLAGEWEKYARVNERYCHNLIRKLRFMDISSPCILFLMSAMTYAFVIARSVSGMYTASQAVVLIMGMTSCLTGCSEILAYRLELFDLAPQNLQHIFDFLDIPDEKYMGTFPTEKREDNEYEFEFKHVSFKYPGSEQYVLRDIDLKWRIGEKMALVGANGSGKSTLVKLLCRLYDPTEGEITLNGIDIRKYSYREYLDLFSVVFQDSKLFSFSIGENVAADTEFEADRVVDCVRRVGLSERLDEMPEGIQTCLYKDFDAKGVEISGGEAQKLCLARAVYKGAPFIILDEPTAALDPVSEHEIYTKFNAITGTKTAIYISHRLASCRFCDDITVLEKGRIVERGSHGHLLEQNGIYAKMWQAQAQYYRESAQEGRIG